MSISSIKTPSLKHLPEDMVDALDRLDIRAYCAGMNQLRPNVNVSRGAWALMWKKVMEQGSICHLELLASKTPDFPEFRNAGYDCLMLSARARNMPVFDHLLASEGFVPGGSLRQKNEFSHEEMEQLHEFLKDCVNNNNHEKVPVYQAVSRLFQKVPISRFSGVVYYRPNALIDSAYNAGDMDATGILLSQFKSTQTYYYQNDNSSSWLLSKLKFGKMDDIARLTHACQENADFGRVYYSLFPLYDTTMLYNKEVRIKIENTWEGVLLLGGDSVADLCLSPDSPMPKESLHVLGDEDAMAMFLCKMAHKPTALARILGNIPYVRRKFETWKSPEGDNAVHLLLLEIPDPSSLVKAGKLTAWLDKNASELFVPFANGDSIDAYISEKFPLWGMKRRRAALTKIARDSGVKHVSSVPRRAM